MMAEVGWTPPSTSSTLAFLAIVATVALLFVLGVERSGRARGDSQPAIRRDARLALAGIAGWMALGAGLAASGVLAAAAMPPPLMLFFAGTLLVALGAALSPLGARLAAGVPLAAIIGFQAFRLPLELVLHRWYLEGAIPVQMTYEGHNFDIATGVLATLVGLGLWRGLLSRRSAWAFTIIGLALLAAVGTIAALSSPIPIRRYHQGPPLLLALHVPYVWIVSICVAGALFGHVVALRSLLRRGATARRPSSGSADRST